jgi:hypothetical protein
MWKLIRIKPDGSYYTAESGEVAERIVSIYIYEEIIITFIFI